ALRMNMMISYQELVRTFLSSASSNTAFLMLLIFIGSLLFRMSTMNCYNITIPNGRIPVAFLRSVKSRCGIFAGGITYKGGMDSTNRRNLQLAGLWRGFH
ncbi:hypothetical protein Q0S14_21555, partial [Escherichia coli O83:H32]